MQKDNSKQYISNSCSSGKMNQQFEIVVDAIPLMM